MTCLVSPNYDRQTGLLFTGDSLYPGRLYVADFAAFVASTQRLVHFTQGKIVAQVLGCHIDQRRTLYLDYKVGTQYQPDEHSLELGRSGLYYLAEVSRPFLKADWLLCRETSSC